jgi:hypothetical protein
MYERAHHRRIAQVLHAMDGTLLRTHACYFGGDTAMALRYGEYRESVEIDFLCADLSHYRDLRQLLTHPQGVQALMRPHAAPLRALREVRADAYGIRTVVAVDEVPIKFELIFEARIVLEPPGPQDEICGVPCLCPMDLVASKLLANSDRFLDGSVFQRDAIDLAMMQADRKTFQGGLAKAGAAYKIEVVRNDLDRALTLLFTREGWLQRCMHALQMTLPPAVVWKQLKGLGQLLEKTR